MRTVAVGLVLLMSSALWAQKIPLNVKVGLWETTATHSSVGQMPVSDQMMAKLTPEQRARIEAAMKAQGKSTTVTYKSCLTKEELDRGTGFGNKKECTETPVTSNRSQLTVKMSCDMQGAKANGTVEFQALTSEHVKGTGHITVSGSGHTMESNSTFDSKWLGPNCGAVN